MKSNKKNILSSQEINIFVNDSYMKMIRIANFFLIPMGILAALGIPIFMADKDIENLMYTTFILGCSIFLFVLWMRLRKKMIRVTSEGIWYKEHFFERRDVEYSIISENKVKLVFRNIHKKIIINRWYVNYDKLLDWLEKCKN